MPPGKFRKIYSPEEVKLTCYGIKEVELSIRKSRDRFGMPMSKLLDRVNGGCSDQIEQPTVVKDEEEVLLGHIPFLLGRVSFCGGIFGQDGNQYKVY
jgi:hypothetical protein